MALLLGETDPWAAEEGAATGQEASYNPVRDYAGLSDLLIDQLRRGNVVNAFLAAAGMNQILEDHIHRDLGELKKAARHVSHLAGLPTRRIGAALEGLGGALQRSYPAIRERHLIRLALDLAELVQSLADQVAGVRDADDAIVDEARELSQALLDSSAQLGRRVVRLPACFTTFDQRPADLRQLATDFSERWRDRGRPLALVGIRTSGSYLAPLTASFLDALGYSDIEVVSWRPEQEWLRNERLRLRATLRAGGLALVVDDPPTSGRSLAGAASSLERVDFRHEDVVLLFASFKSPASWEWPQRLNAYQSVILPWEGWAIHERLKPLAVRRTLAASLTGRRVQVFTPGGEGHIRVGAIGDVERIPVPQSSERRTVHYRGHVRALYRVQLIEQGTGTAVQHHVYAKGIGLGYLGDASVAIADRLPEFIAPVYGARDGIMYRAWLPEACRLDQMRPSDDEETAEHMATYVVARSRALSVPEPTSERLVTERASWGETVWQSAAQLLSPAFGRAAPAVRALLRRTFLRLLPVRTPAIIDGAMEPSRWFAIANGGDRVLLKTGVDAGAYRAGTVHCYDPLFDVAAAAVGEDDPFVDALRRAYVEQADSSSSEERWLIYRLLATQDWWDKRSPTTADGQRARAMSRLVQRYFGDLYLRDVAPPTGRLCAIDIDGVLETSWLGFPSITPAGVLALRALATHGYRAILVTGRSLDEVRDRCQAYHLVGGVAEYGAVVYNHQTGLVTPMLTAADHTRLGDMRSVLAPIEGVHIDPTHRYAVRAYRIRSGERCGLDGETIHNALTAAGSSLVAIEGRSQTDFITPAFDKATGLEALAGQLALDGAGESRTHVEFAVGDTASDLPVFQLASRSFAPANADDAVCRASDDGLRVTIVKRPHQAGLLEAVSAFLGHRAGGCPTCRVPSLSAEARCLLKILAAQDLGRWGKLRHLLALAVGNR